MEDEKSAKPNSSSKKIDVVLRDLDVLLRKEFGDNVTVDSFETYNLVPPGENYGSTMLAVEAMIKRDGADSEPERLSLVAKMIPPTEFQKMMFDSPFTFRKEIYMFNSIVPAYKALELEHGIPETEVFDLLPKVYGVRLSLNEGDEKFDDDAVILMENLKIKNYACGDRKVGFDLKNAKSVVEALAYFHATGIALKLIKPDFFEEVKEHAKSMEFKKEFMSDMEEFILNDMRKSPELIPHLKKIELIVRNSDAELWLKPAAEPWATIVHTDLWTNNVMLSTDENGDTNGVKLVDFQNYLYQNPMRDLIFFIFSSCKKIVRETHVDEMIDFYYEKILFYLSRLGCDNRDSFNRESFDKELIAAARIEYIHCIVMSRVILADQTDPSVTNPELIFSTESSDRCRELMVETTLTFIDKNWL